MRRMRRRGELKRKEGEEEKRSKNQGKKGDERSKRKNTSKENIGKEARRCEMMREE